MSDLIYNLAVRRCIDPVVKTTGTGAGVTVDRAGYDNVLAVLACGIQAGTSSTFKLEDSDDDSTWADVVAADCLGGTPSIVVATTNDVKNHTREYIGHKRYVRWNMSAQSSGNLVVGAHFVLGNKIHAPTAEEAAG